MPESILSLDVGTLRLGLARFDARYHTLTKAWEYELGRDPISRLADAYEAAQLLVDRHTVVVPEWPMGANRNAQSALMEVLGAFKAGCTNARWVHPGLTPTEWKKATIGKGNASKVEVCDWVMAEYRDERPGLSNEHQDVFDAIAIGRAGVAWWASRKEAAA